MTAAPVAGDRPAFDYQQAFARNLGWVTSAELTHLAERRIAIAGLGGVGGRHLLSLTRLGIGGFRIADFDDFELANFNRQAGASLPHLGRPKVDVLAEMALAINPGLDLVRFPAGVTPANLDRFLEQTDCYLDGLDFFATATRAAVFAACAERGIPAITAAPLGWGVAMLVFVPGGMTFEDYFQLAEQSEAEQWRRFLVGLSPSLAPMQALVDPTRLDLDQRTGPSTVVGCELCAALAATAAIKLLLGRSEVPAAPVSLHFDAFTGQCQQLEFPGGVAHPALRTALQTLRAQRE